FDHSRNLPERAGSRPMMTRGHRQEALSRAYVQAVAAKAGVSCSRPDPDYGTDLCLREVEEGPDGRFFDTGVQVDLQLRSTTKATIKDTQVVYDLDIKMYNDLRVPRRTPRFLVVFVLPTDEAEWVSQTSAGLLLRHGAYWISLEGQRERKSKNTI